MNKYLPMPDEMTIGEAYSPAMEMTDASDALMYREALMERLARFHPEMTPAQIESAIMSNLGYYAGYYSYETRQRVQALFGAVHPIFGSTQPTPEEAFKAGYDMGKGKQE